MGLADASPHPLSLILEFLPEMQRNGVRLPQKRVAATRVLSIGLCFDA